MASTILLTKGAVCFGLCPLFSGAGRRPVRETAPRQGSLPELRARRNPMLLFRLSGLLLLSRLATAALSALLFQLPPRMRRLEVPSSPWPPPESEVEEPVVGIARCTPFLPTHPSPWPSSAPALHSSETPQAICPEDQCVSPIAGDCGDSAPDVAHTSCSLGTALRWTLDRSSPA